MYSFHYKSKPEVLEILIFKKQPKSASFVLAFVLNPALPGGWSSFLASRALTCGEGRLCQGTARDCDPMHPMIMRMGLRTGELRLHDGRHRSGEALFQCVSRGRAVGIHRTMMRGGGRVHGWSDWGVFVRKSGSRDRLAHRAGLATELQCLLQDARAAHLEGVRL